MFILIWVSYAIITIIFQTSYEIARKVLTVEEKMIYTFIGSLVLYIVIISFCMYQTAHKSVPQNADYVLVLGSKVDGDQMSPSLKERAKTALSYLKTHKQTKVIVTGGKGSDEEISEAEAAYRFLRKAGIKKNRIIKRVSQLLLLRILLSPKES